MTHISRRTWEATQWAWVNKSRVGAGWGQGEVGIDLDGNGFHTHTHTNTQMGLGKHELGGKERLGLSKGFLRERERDTAKQGPMAFNFKIERQNWTVGVQFWPQNDNTTLFWREAHPAVL